MLMRLMRVTIGTFRQILVVQGKNIRALADSVEVFDMDFAMLI
jgi:hypothetical protein